MTFDLTIGFREKPKDLGDTLTALGFTLDRIVPIEETLDVTMEFYEFYDLNRSAGGIYFAHHDGIYADHHESWKNIVADPSTIVAMGSLTTSMRRNAFDTTKQHEVGRFLRDYYGAILYDPQSGSVLRKPSTQ